MKVNSTNPLTALVESVTPDLARISDYPAHFAQSAPKSQAATCLAAELSYGELAKEIDDCARALIAAGIERGDRVAMLSPPNTRFLVVFLATARIGGVWMGLNPKHQLPEYEYVLGDAAPKLLLVQPQIGDRHFAHEMATLFEKCHIRTVTLDEAPPSFALGWSAFIALGANTTDPVLEARIAAVRSSDAALLVYTSGSTGQPKGALLPHRGLVKGARRRAACWWHGPFRSLMNLPINHIGGVGDIVCTTLVTGGMLAFMERFDAGGSLRLIERQRLTFWYQIPTQLQMSLADPDAASRDLSSLKAVIWSGARAPLPLIQQLQHLCPGRLGTDYSMTESIGAVTMTPLGADVDVLEHSVGWPDPAREIKLADNGEILVRDDGIMMGYLNREADTAEAVDSDGWLHTGDIGLLRSDGTIVLSGRLKEMFKSGGYNVYPKEIEQTLESHPAVAQAAVVAAPDALYGEVGHAYVSLHRGATATSIELNDFCRSRLANYKVPKAISIESELPLLPIGKIDKASLKRRLAAHNR